MAGKTREIKGRIKAVGNIQRITKTMQMIATARFQAMQKRATSTQAYTRKIAEIVGELADSLAGGGMVEHPLLSAPEPVRGRRLLLVLTSNRGLAGAYNANVLRASMRFLKRHEHETIDVEVVGKKAVNYFRFNQVAVAQFHGQFSDTPAYDLVEQLAQRYMETFRQGQYDAVDVAFTAFHSMSRQTPEIIRLLPLENPAGEERKQKGATPWYEFSPDPQTLLDELLPITVKTALFQCFNESVVSEQLARMVAMKSATDAANKMKRGLQRQFNRARQSAITTELTEIIGGAAALE